MENFLKLIIAFGIGFILVVLAMPKVIPFLHKMKFGQVEREEGLESHKSKNGTPTMGGIVFVIAAILGAFIVNFNNLLDPELILATIVLVGYSAIGFVDDALIIVKHSNKGLPPLAKLLAQIALAIICYFFAMNFIPDFTSVITIPLLDINIDMGYLYPALILVMFAAFIIFSIMTKDYTLASYATAMVGALLGFMMFNYHPAKIFMGDVGSLGLGGFLAILAILTKQELLLILVGGVFLMETLSVIIQVVSFKTRGKRVFKMAPIHHHFEMLGWSEQQVTISFWFIGFICGILSIVIGVL